MGKTAVHFKAAILLLFIYCLLLLKLFVGALCLVFVLLISTLCHTSFAVNLMRKRELVVLL